MMIDKKLFNILYKLVSKPKLAGKYYKPISIRIKKLKEEFNNTPSTLPTLPSEYKLFSANKELNLKVAMWFYNTLMTTVVKGVPVLSRFDSTKGKYSSFVTMVLRNIIVNEAKHNKYHNNLIVSEEDPLDSTTVIDEDDTTYEDFSALRSVIYLQAVEVNQNIDLLGTAQYLYGEEVVELLIGGFTVYQIANKLDKPYREFLKNYNDATVIFKFFLYDSGYDMDIDAYLIEEDIQ